MPRKKHSFINRAKAKTYQLVHRSGGKAGDGTLPVLVPVNSAPSAGTQVASSVGDSAKDLIQRLGDEEEEAELANLFSTYEKDEYEFGEFGFPDDGYDYSQHFKTIGGGGGVFMDAATGMSNPDAVTGSYSSQAKVSGANSKDAIVLKDGAGDGAEQKPNSVWKRKEDFMRGLKAVEEIKRERKRNKDLDDVFAALDSDGELESSSHFDDEAEEELDDSVMDGLESVEDELLEDDFVIVAQQASDIAEDFSETLEGVIEQFREPRLLDEQFEKFMRGYELEDSGEEEEDYFPNENLDTVENLEDIQAHLTNDELEGIWADEGLLGEMSALNISSEEDRENIAIPEHDSVLEAGMVEVTVAGATDRASEYQDFANAEFERGMKGLLDSYNRVSAEEAFGAIEGVDVALEAIARGEEEERVKCEKRLELGLDDDSDGHDSELDSKFDEMFKEPEEKWDCETILSTYSKLENHPSVIDAPASHKRRPVQNQPIIRLDPRTQAPAEYMPGNGSGFSSGAGPVDFGSRRDVQGAQVRARDETKLEKKARKAAVKEAARERRALKSEMKKAFGSEHVKQSRHATAMGTSKVAIQFQ